MGDYALSGLLPGGSSSVFLFSSSEYDERWVEAELRTAELIGRIQPSRPSEERRKAVIEYVERLIRRHFDCKVFTFGSVPLKTYLPDGDIDLTAFSELRHLNDTWANDLRCILENEEHSKDAEFRVKEVNCIHAEVQVVKCLVENIIVDITFSQLGGLSTLCFLEEVDRLIGQDHLFKRSIILVKAWCYYESRILGAHHGLISSYALETMVLYIFHVFHLSLRGPLEVLFRFLEFFSKFDWDHYCLSIWGPIPLSSLQDMVAEPPQKDGGQLLLSKAFLDACSQAYAIFPGSQDTQGRTFNRKFMNVVDPLRTNNNIGRSVNKGNFVRIHSAFAYGARKLEKLLRSPQEELAEKLNAFFLNTEKHGSGHRPDAPVLSFEHPQVDLAISPEAGTKTEDSNLEANNKTVTQAETAIATKKHINCLNQTDGVETQGLPANETNELCLLVDHVTGTSEATMLCTDVNVLGLSGLNGDTYRAGDSCQTGEVKQVTTCKDENPCIAMFGDPPATSRRRGKGPHAIDAIRMQKKSPSSDLDSCSLANELILNNRGHIENAKDLASYQHGCRDCGLPNSLEKQAPFQDSKKQSSNSGTASSLGLLVSSKEKLRSQAHTSQGQGSFYEVDGGEEHIERGVALHKKDLCCVFAGEVLRNDQEQVLSVEASLCSQKKTNDRDNGPCADRLLVKSQLTPALHEANSVTNQGSALPLLETCVTNIGIPAACQHPVLEKATASVCPTSFLSEYGEDQQNQWDYQEHPRNSSQSCLGSMAPREAWSDLTCAEAPVVPPAIPARTCAPNSSKKASTGNESIGSMAKDDDGSVKTLTKVSELEVSSGLVEDESETLRLQDGLRELQENISSFSKRSSCAYHEHDSVSSITYVDGCGKTLAKVLELEAGSVLEVREREIQGLQAGGRSQEKTIIIGKERNHHNSISSSKGSSVEFGEGKEMESVLVRTGIDDTLTRDKETATSLSLPDCLTVQQKQRTLEAAAQQSVSTITSQVDVPAVKEPWNPLAEPTVMALNSSQQPRPTDNTGFLPFAYSYPTMPNNLYDKMNPMSDGKARLDLGGVADGIYHLETPHEPSRAESAGERLVAFGIPVSAGSSLNVEVDVGVSEGSEAKGMQADILRGDFATHLQNLEAGRCLQNSHLHGPLLFASPVLSPPRSIQGNYSWEVPGRSTPANVNTFTPMLSYRHGLLPASPLHGANLQNMFAVPSGIYAEELPKSHRGTGTYLPNLRPVAYRDRRWTSGGRGQQRANSLDHRDPVSHDGTRAFATRYRGMGRGQNKHHGHSHMSKMNTRLERNNVEGQVGEQGWDTSRQETFHRSSLFIPSNSSANAGNFFYPPKRDTDLGVSSEAFSIEKLEFGTLGRVKPEVALAGNDQDAPAGKENTGLASENKHITKHGEPTQSVERLTREAHSIGHHQSSSQCSYQLKEEDFPPLSFYGQPGRSVGFSVQKISANQGSHYQACVVGPSS